VRSFVLAIAALLTLWTTFPESADDPGQRPITTDSGPVGNLLRQWWRDGTAAGNSGDWYDNRDALHSDLNMDPFPQLQRITYSPKEIDAGAHYAVARVIRPQVTFGNSSTSAPPENTGSNPRTYYCLPQGLAFLATQYQHNNLYIYPEHRDHDPGHNGTGGGFGDLYPTNTPYLIISQGSSGSDQPFMRALPFTLAAFRPEVKERLTKTGLLMPTVQMILRRANRHLKGPEEYRTGKAHPTVFEGSWVDDLAMVRLAHELTLEALPPRVSLKVVSEEKLEAGKDFFDAASEEMLADTPSVIARIWRGTSRMRKLVVSAAESSDVNSRPLSYHWVVLRGPVDQIRIEPKNAKGSVVELTVPYPERRPVADGRALESNRIDIGVFVNNGAYDSAPGFVTFFGLDSEARVYDERGQIVEIGYGMGETAIDVRDWQRWCEQAVGKAAVAAGLQVSPADREAIEAAASRLATLQARTAELDERIRLVASQVQAAEALALKATTAIEKDAQAVARKLANADLQRLQRQRQEWTAAREEELEGKKGKFALRRFADATMRACMRQPNFVASLTSGPAWNAASLDARRAVRPALAEFAGLGYDVAVPPATPFGKARFEHLCAVVLERMIFPESLAVTYRSNFVDSRLTAPRHWRDVYRYHEKGGLLGWTRHEGPTRQEYSAQGFLVLERDALGRCTVGRRVHYRQQPVGAGQPNPHDLHIVPTPEVVHLSYADDSDFAGKSARVEIRPIGN
jgi:hypothetical protein